MAKLVRQEWVDPKTGLLCSRYITHAQFERYLQDYVDKLMEYRDARTH